MLPGVLAALARSKCDLCVAQVLVGGVVRWFWFSSSALVSWCGGADGGGGGEVPAGDGGGAQPLGGVLGLHRHLQQGSHELPRLQLCHNFDKLASPGYVLLSPCGIMYEAL